MTASVLYDFEFTVRPITLYRVLCAVGQVFLFYEQRNHNTYMIPANDKTILHPRSTLWSLSMIEQTQSFALGTMIIINESSK